MSDDPEPFVPGFAPGSDAWEAAAKFRAALDEEARHPERRRSQLQAERSAAPSAFAELFQEHLSLRLTNLCVAQARCVAAGVETFEGAFVAVMRYARHYGASLLPEHTFKELEDWVVAALGTAIFEAEALGYDHWLEDNHVHGGRVP